MAQEGSESKEATGAPEASGEAPSPAPGSPLGARRRSLLIAAAVVFVLLASLPLGFAVDRAAASGEVLRGVSAGGVLLEGFDRAEAERAVAELADRLQKEPIRVRVRAQAFEIEPSALNFRVDTAGTVEAALAEGRQGGVLSQFGWWLGRFKSQVDVGVLTSIDEAPLDAAIAGWEAKAIEDPPFEGAVALEGEGKSARPAPDYPRSGHGIDREGARRAVRGVLGRDRRNAVDLPLMVVSAHVDRAAVDAAVERARAIVAGSVTLSAARPEGSPESGGGGGGGGDKEASGGGAKKKKKGGDGDAPKEELPARVTVTWGAQDLARALRSRVVMGEGGARRVEVYLDPIVIDERLRPVRPLLETKPADARFVIDDRDKVTVLPSRAGTRLEADRATAAILTAVSAPDRSGDLPVDIGDPPEFSTESAAALRISRLVSQATTRHVCCQPRVKNIHRIADLIDGRIVRPGETLSLNAAVGERTKANGFVMAPSIADGEMVDTMGGGVSQFATTYFNAMFYGGYDIIERQPHSFYFSRYPMGHEATLSWPKPDVIIRNDTEAGMLIKCIYSDTSITVKLYGDNGGRKVRAKVSSRQDIVPPPIELIANPKLEPDEEKVKESGEIGWSVIVARILTYPDGTTKEERRKVTYKPRVRRIQVHPCKIPKGEEGYTGEPCPKPEEEEEGEEGKDPAAGPDGSAPPPPPVSPPSPIAPSPF
jgi:vancomycin resistance protein YoaR